MFLKRNYYYFINLENENNDKKNGFEMELSVK